MSSFTGELTITEVSANWRVWRIEQDFVYEVGAEGSGRTIVVPRGFVTDGASIPRLFWAFLPSWGSYSRAAVVHDLLCHLVHLGQPHPEAPTRRDADRIFWEAMEVCGTNLVTRTILWLGARFGSLLPFTNLIEAYNKLPAAD